MIGRFRLRRLPLAIFCLSALILGRGAWLLFADRWTPTGGEMVGYRLDTERSDGLFWATTLYFEEVAGVATLDVSHRYRTADFPRRRHLERHLERYLGQRTALWKRYENGRLRATIEPKADPWHYLFPGLIGMVLSVLVFVLDRRFLDPRTEGGGGSEPDRGTRGGRDRGTGS